MARTNNLTSIERKKRTVQTVIELCHTLEPAAITTAVIAEHMGVTQGALFRHFPSKNAIWEEVTLWVSQQIIDLLDEKLADAEQPLNNLHAMYLAHIQFISRYSGIPRLIFSQLHIINATPAHKIMSSLMKTYQGRIKLQISAGIELGMIDPKINIDATASMFLGAIQGTVVKALVHNENALSINAAENMFEIFRRGIELNNNKN